MHFIHIIIAHAILVVVVLFVGCFYLARYEAGGSVNQVFNYKFGRCMHYAGILSIWMLLVAAITGLFYAVFALLHLPDARLLEFVALLLGYLISAPFMYFANKAGF